MIISMADIAPVLHRFSCKFTPSSHRINEKFSNITFEDITFSRLGKHIFMYERNVYISGFKKSLPVIAKRSQYARQFLAFEIAYTVAK